MQVDIIFYCCYVLVLNKRNTSPLTIYNGMLESLAELFIAIKAVNVMVLSKCENTA